MKPGKDTENLVVVRSIETDKPDRVELIYLHQPPEGPEPVHIHGGFDLVVTPGKPWLADPSFAAKLIGAVPQIHDFGQIKAAAQKLVHGPTETVTEQQALEQVEEEASN